MTKKNTTPNHHSDNILHCDNSVYCVFKWQSKPFDTLLVGLPSSPPPPITTAAIKDNKDIGVSLQHRPVDLYAFGMWEGESGLIEARNY